jgi:hypothetical protein
LAAVKSRFPKASVLGLEDLRVFYLLADDPKMYYTYAKVESLPGGMDRKMALRKIGRSLKDLSKEWQMLNKLVG